MRKELKAPVVRDDRSLDPFARLAQTVIYCDDQAADNAALIVGFDPQNSRIANLQVFSRYGGQYFVAAVRQDQDRSLNTWRISWEEAPHAD